MHSFCTLALLGTSSAFTYQQNFFSDSACTTATSKFPPNMCVSGTCCPMTAMNSSLQLKYTGTCSAAVYNKYNTKADCEAGTGGTVMSTTDLAAFAAGGCQPSGDTFATITTSCSGNAGNAGNSVTPGAWSVVAAAAAVVAVMKL